MAYLRIDYSYNKYRSGIRQRYEKDRSRGLSCVALVYINCTRISLEGNSIETSRLYKSNDRRQSSSLLMLLLLLWFLMADFSMSKDRRTSGLCNDALIIASAVYTRSSLSVSLIYNCLSSVYWVDDHILGSGSRYGQSSLRFSCRIHRSYTPSVPQLALECDAQPRVRWVDKWTVRRATTESTRLRIRKWTYS